MTSLLKFGNNHYLVEAVLAVTVDFDPPGYAVNVRFRDGVVVFHDKRTVAGRASKIADALVAAIEQHKAVARLQE